MGWKLEGLGLDVKWENTERDDWKRGILESGRNLIQGKCPQIYKDDPTMTPSNTGYVP